MPHKILKRNLNAQLNLSGLPEDENQEWRWPDAKAKEEGKKSEEQVIVYRCENILNIQTHLHVLGLLPGADERLGRSTEYVGVFLSVSRAAYQGRMSAG